jgi:hypothetical protein
VACSVTKEPTAAYASAGNSYRLTLSARAYDQHFIIGKIVGFARHKELVCPSNRAIVFVNISIERSEPLAQSEDLMCTSTACANIRRLTLVQGMDQRRCWL